MDSPLTTFQKLAADMPFATLLGMMILAFVGSMLVLAFILYVVRTFKAVRRYEAAHQQVKLIESKLAEMNNGAMELQRQLDLKLIEARENYQKDLFALQQTIFDRNSEILDLKNQLLQRK